MTHCTRADGDEEVEFAVYHAVGNRYFAVAANLSQLAYSPFEIAFYQES